MRTCLFGSIDPPEAAGATLASRLHGFPALKITHGIGRK
jgi:hypothetical protein